MTDESIFATAAALKTEAERQAYLDQVCAGNPDLRSEVEALLKADAGAGSFLNHPPVGTDATIAMSADHDTVDSNSGPVSLAFLQPCETPGRIGKIDHYEVIEVVGQGGMGVVLRAMDTKLSRIVAVKVMAPELAANPTAVKRFLREASTAAAVHHDHVVTIHAVGDHHRPPYIVMQFIEGQTLQQKIDKEGALEIKQLLRIGSQMAAGLAAAHKHGLIHRDVKPANILLENGVERVKITDFGLARATDDLEMTQTGVIAGTPQYMSPEQAKGEPIDSRADLFSLGSVLYTMCTGRPGFRAETTMGVLKRVCDDVPRPIHEVNAEIPPWLEAIVFKLLAKNPADRFQTATEVAELLSQHLAHVQNPTQMARPATVIVPLTRQVQVDPSHSSGWSPAVAILAVLGALAILPVALILIALTAYFAFSRTSLRQQTTVAAANVPATTETTLESVAVPTPPTVDCLEWGEFLDSVGNCQFERRNGQVAFRLPGSMPYNLLPTAVGGDNAPRLLHDAEGDFVLQVRVLPFGKSQPDSSTAGPQMASWRSAGLVVLGDNQSIVRLERVSWGEQRKGAPLAHCEWFVGGERKADHYENLKDDERFTMLQIERRGNALHLRYSDDGDRWEKWQTITDLKLPSSLRVGLVAVHTTPTEFDPVFEDLRFEDATSNSTEIPADSDWKPLFNGQDLTGWTRHPDAPGAWLVKDKTLTGRGVNQYLYTTRGDYKDFHLRAEVRINAPGDGGILVRMAPPADPPAAIGGYEVQLMGDPDHASPTASIIPHGSDVMGRGVRGRGDLTRTGEWFTMEVSAIGGKLTVAINGREVVSYRDEAPRTSGHIAFQSFTEGTEVSFRNIEIAELRSSTAPPAAVAPFTAAEATAHQDAWAAHLGVPTEIENSVGMKLRLIPPGEFTMGTDPAALDQLVARLSSEEQLEFVENLDQEKTPRQARVREPFYLGTCEVTVGQFRQFALETDFQTDAEKSGDGGWSGRDGKWIRHKEHIWKTPGAWPLADDQPVVHVSYHDAQAFCTWLSQQENRRYALPTDVQWEFAARAGTTELFGGTDDPAALATSAWYKSSLPDDHRNQPQAVGGLAANQFGLFDMLGNVWEATSTWHPVVSDRRIIRGGSWYNQALMARPALRSKGSRPNVAMDAGTGFRVAIVGDLRPPPPPRAVAPFDAPQARAHQDAWAKHLGVQVAHTNKVGMKMRLIPPGEFLMGSTQADTDQLARTLEQGGANDFDKFVARMSSPQHKVRLTKPFRLSECEVTVGQYRQFIEATKYVPSMEQLGVKRFQWTGSAVEPNADQRAVIGVSWDDAKAFCKWLSEEEGQTYDLPSEAQWEFACRAGTTTAWSFGDEASGLEPHAVFGRPSFWPAEVVGSKTANPFGLFDMHGNADEWCLDWHQRDFYANSPTDDPVCTTNPQDKNSGRVARGGTSLSAPWWTRSTTRAFDFPATPNNPKGFRVATSVAAVKQAAMAAPDSPEVKALRELVAIRQRGRDAIEERFKAGQEPPTAVVTADVELIDARIRLAEAENQPEAVLTLLKELVAKHTEVRTLTKQLVDAGIQPQAVLDAVDARLAEAKIRLAKAEAAAKSKDQ
jgi:formylglycine-generating enzyme required for sulfatase activity/serine/threonine protein kinase